MAVIVSDNRNPAYDEMLATANGFYRAEAYNLGLYNATPTGYINNTLGGIVYPTFANAGNLAGVVLPLYTTSTYGNPYGVMVDLEEKKGTCTFSIGTPCVVTLTGHGFTGGERVSFSTTGAMPAQFTLFREYYVKYIDANTFNLSLTLGGANINTTGTQSGIHTLWVSRAYKYKTCAEINPSFTQNGTVGVNTQYPLGVFITDFKFPTPYAVDTTANKWRITTRDYTAIGAPSFVWSLVTSDGTNMGYVAYSDTQVTATDGDILIVTDKLQINKDFTTGSALGTGDTLVGCAGWVCTGDMTKYGMAKLVWEETPTASYTFTFGGYIYTARFGGFRMGTEENPIPSAYQAKLRRLINSTTGSSTFCGFLQVMATTSSRPRSYGTLQMYGEIATNFHTNLASDVVVGANKFYTTEDMSATWQVGDQIFIGKQEGQNQGRLDLYSITAITGIEVSISPNNSICKKLAGATVINKSRPFGIDVRGYSNNKYINFQFDQPTHLNVTGTYQENAALVLYVARSYNTYPPMLQYSSKHIINDNLFYVDGNALFNAVYAFVIARQGMEIKRNYAIRASIAYVTMAVYSKQISSIPFFSGILEFENNVTLSSYSGALGTSSTNHKIKCWNNKWENSELSTPKVLLAGMYVDFRNNYFYGIKSSYAYTGTAGMSTSVNATLENNTFENCGCAYGMGVNSTILNTVSKNDIFINNTQDLGHINSGYYQVTFKNPSRVLVIDPATDFSIGVPGSYVAIEKNGTVQNVDYRKTPAGDFVRCGDGLTDTTVRTPGTGKFSLRYEPGLGSLEFIQKVPTGNIQGKTMTVSAWVKINSANYYSGTYVLPRLTINYDDGTIAYAQASETTDWQQIFVTFTPTTITGEITITVSAETDQSGTNAYVYLDDMNIAYPAGYTLDLGGLDIWSNAIPVSPTIATFPNLGGVRDELTSGHNIEGSYGKDVKKSNKIISRLQDLL